MIDYREDPTTNIIEITIDGTISRAEFATVAANLEAQITKYGKVYVLEEIRRIGGIDPYVFWEDLTFGLKHLSHISHCAIVSDQQWLKLITHSIQPLVSCQIRSFNLGEIDEARRWLREIAAQSRSGNGHG